MTPVILKIIELIIRERIQPIILQNQDPLQRDFTYGRKSEYLFIPEK